MAKLQKDETEKWFCLQCNFASRKVSMWKHTLNQNMFRLVVLSVHFAQKYMSLSKFDHFLCRFGWVDWTKYAKRWIRYLGLYAVWVYFKQDEQCKESYRSKTYRVQDAVSSTRHAMKMHMLRKPGKNGTEQLFSALNDAIRAKIYKADSGLFTCYECGYSSKYKTTCQDHIESRHISTSGYTCPYCQKFCPTRNALKSHISKNHK